jgi:hypothetical protein
MNQHIFEAIFFSGVLAIFVSVVWMAGLAWTRSIWWGLANMLIPFAVVLFAIFHWDRAKWPFLLYVSSAVITCGTIYMFPDSMREFAHTKHTISLGKSKLEQMQESVQTDADKLADYLAHHDLSSAETVTYARELFAKTEWLNGQEFEKALLKTGLAKDHEFACLDDEFFGHERGGQLLEITEKKPDGKTLGVYINLEKMQDVFVRPSASAQMQNLAVVIKEKGLAGSNDTIQACDKAFQNVGNSAPKEVENALQSQLGDQYQVEEIFTDKFRKETKKNAFRCIQIRKKAEPYALQVLLNQGGAMIDFDFPQI